MDIPTAGPSHRSINIRIRAKFDETPAVTATVVQAQGAPSLFNISSIKVNESGAETLGAIEAQNLNNGHSISDLFLCNYVIIGKGITT